MDCMGHERILDKFIGKIFLGNVPNVIIDLIRNPALKCIQKVSFIINDYFLMHFKIKLIEVETER